jgi:DNA-binding XRE family transcriptional regulator
MSDAIPLPRGGDKEGVQTELGARLRAARMSRNLALRELSRRIGVSASMVSQIERGSVMPSVATLYRLVSELGISLDELFSGESAGVAAIDAPVSEARTAPSPVQRKADRPTVTLASGVRWERLTSSPDPQAEFIWSHYPVGGESCPADALVRHGGREFGYVESGRLGVTIGFDTYELKAGDSISFDSSTPHRLFTIGDEPADVIWMVLGRSGDPRSTP